MVKLINKLYHEEHKHKIGENSWTVEDNFSWRQQYAPAILAEIKDKLDEILKKPNLLPGSELSEARQLLQQRMGGGSRHLQERRHRT
jgi:predicted choloylglycine hydrolase